jgi:hypothetical protein
MGIEARRRWEHAPATRETAQRSRAPSDDALGDLRFRSLLSEADWERLTPAVRRRFARRLAPGETALYVGQVEWTRMTPMGRCLCTAARLIGAPLPTAAGGRMAAAAAVTECEALGGQIWTRLYARDAQFPQVIQSTKRFAGPTGLEECLPCGVGMQLAVGVEAGALVFRSTGYFIELFGRCIPLPASLCPGVITVSHREIDPTRFVFELTVDHPWFGRVLEQGAQFSDASEVDSCRRPAS